MFKKLFDIAVSENTMGSTPERMFYRAVFGLCRINLPFLSSFNNFYSVNIFIEVALMPNEPKAEGLRDVGKYPLPLYKNFTFNELSR